MRKKEEIRDAWITCSVTGTRSCCIHTDPGRTVAEVIELLRAGVAEVYADSIQTLIDGKHVRLARILDTAEDLMADGWRENTSAEQLAEEQSGEWLSV
jgi:hypothetical protein